MGMSLSGSGLEGMGSKSFLSALTDRSALSLAGSNLVALLLALLLDWGLPYLLWVYWCQSVIIGYYSWRRMGALKSFSTEGFSSGGSRVPETEQGKRATTVFFAMHYGFFHFVYLIFLLAFSRDFSLADFAGLALAVAAFQRNHGYSFRWHLEADLRRRPNLGSMMFFPYLRVIPMHLSIILGAALGGGAGGLLLFTGLKTASDLLMHAIEHSWTGTPPREAAQGE